MPKAVNPLVQISKKLESLKAKSAKLNEEIEALSALVALEAQKSAEMAANNPEVKAPVKAKAVKGEGAPKKVKAPSTVKDPAEASASPKKRGRPKNVK